MFIPSAYVCLDVISVQSGEKGEAKLSRWFGPCICMCACGAGVGWGVTRGHLITTRGSFPKERGTWAEEGGGRGVFWRSPAGGREKSRSLGISKKNAFCFGFSVKRLLLPLFWKAASDLSSPIIPNVQDKSTS